MNFHNFRQILKIFDLTVMVARCVFGLFESESIVQIEVAPLARALEQIFD